MIAIRPASSADAAELTALDALLFGPDAWSAAGMDAELTGVSRRLLVAVDHAGTIVGYAATMTTGDVVDLLRIGVHPIARRSGVASRLLDDLLDNDDASARMLLEVSADNEPALAFYLHHGFDRIAVRARYYRDGADAVVMSRPLTARVHERMTP